MGFRLQDKIYFSNPIKTTIKNSEYQRKETNVKISIDMETWILFKINFFFHQNFNLKIHNKSQGAQLLLILAPEINVGPQSQRGFVWWPLFSGEWSAAKGRAASIVNNTMFISRYVRFKKTV